jgi:hypothetical protein
MAVLLDEVSGRVFYGLKKTKASHPIQDLTVPPSLIPPLPRVLSPPKNYCRFHVLGGGGVVLIIAAIIPFLPAVIYFAVKHFSKLETIY